MTDEINKRLDTMNEDISELAQRGHVTNEFLESIKESLEVAHENIESLSPPAPNCTELYAAFVKAQLTIKNAVLNTDNDFTKKKYADLASVMDAVRGPLAEQGLAIMQFTADESISVLGIRTVLVHESGQFVEDIITMSPPKNDPQGIGSCRTYMRRYAVLALIGIAGAVDDDAEGASKDPNDYERISIGEVEKIIYEADELFSEHADDAVKLMLTKLFNGAPAVGDIPAGQKDVALNYLQNAKKARDKREAAAVKKEALALKAAAEEK